LYIHSPQILFAPEVETGVAPAPTESEVVVETEPKVEAEPKAPEAPAPVEPPSTPWYEKRISELSAARNEERKRAETLQAEILRIQAAAQPAAGKGEARYTEQEVAQIVAQRVTAEAQVLDFDRRCQEVYNAGSAAYADFDGAVKTLRETFGLTPEFVETALATGKAADVLYELGKHPEKAQEILALPERAQIIAVANLAAGIAAKPAVRQNSLAPSPISPKVGSASASGEAGLSPDLSMKEWMARRDQMLSKKASR
jgi:hypothetical protein